MAEEKIIKTNKEDPIVVDKITEPTEEKKIEVKEEAKTETREVEKVKVLEKKAVKELAIANGPSLVISPKHSFAVCKMIMGKAPDTAIEMLNNVVLGKQPVKMTGREVAHQKGKGIAGAKFPKKAAIAIAEIVKQVKANALSVGVESPVITLAVANRASAPMRKGGRKGKRTHIHLEVRDKTKLIKKKK